MCLSRCWVLRFGNPIVSCVPTSVRGPKLPFGQREISAAPPDVARPCRGGGLVGAGRIGAALCEAADRNHRFRFQEHGPGGVVDATRSVRALRTVQHEPDTTVYTASSACELPSRDGSCSARPVLRAKPEARLAACLTHSGCQAVRTACAWRGCGYGSWTASSPDRGRCTRAWCSGSEG